MVDLFLIAVSFCAGFTLASLAADSARRRWEDRLRDRYVVAEREKIHEAIAREIHSGILHGCETERQRWSEPSQN